MKRTGFKQKSFAEKIEQQKAAQKRALTRKLDRQKTLTTKKPKKRKPKKRKTRAEWGLREWKKEAWKHFTKWVKTRDKNICVTCGKHATGSGMHGGHFITKATCPPKLYFDETNTHAQCYRCNINLSGNWVAYESFMITRYGKAHVDELKRRQIQEQGQKVDVQYYKDLVEKYKL